MKTIHYIPRGVCSREMEIDVDNDVNLPHGGHPLRLQAHLLPRPAGPGPEAGLKHENLVQTPRKYRPSEEL